MQTIRLLLDQGLPRTAAHLLHALGWDVIHVGEIGMASALDHEIIDLARREARIVVTLDADFHAIIVTTGVSSPSVVRLRVQGLAGADTATLIKTVIEMCRADLEKGAIVSADSKRVKIRRIPIGK